jgi:hypothetical protein
MQKVDRPQPTNFGFTAEMGWPIGRHEEYLFALSLYDEQQAAKPKPIDYGYDPINGWPDAETMERYIGDLHRWFDFPALRGMNEGDFERIESTQEQAARLRDEAEQNQDAEQPFGEHWQKLMRQHSKTELIAALKTALEREAQLRAENVTLSNLKSFSVALTQK